MGKATQAYMQILGGYSPLGEKPERRILGDHGSSCCCYYFLSFLFLAFVAPGGTVRKVTRKNKGHFKIFLVSIKNYIHEEKGANNEGDLGY